MNRDMEDEATHRLDNVLNAVMTRSSTGDLTPRDVIDIVAAEFDGTHATHVAIAIGAFVDLDGQIVATGTGDDARYVRLRCERHPAWWLRAVPMTRAEFDEHTEKTLVAAGLPSREERRRADEDRARRVECERAEERAIMLKQAMSGDLASALAGKGRKPPTGEA